MNKFISNVSGACTELVKRLDIVKVITDDLGPPTKITGSDSFWSCVFHSESTPSFGVHSGLQAFKCFGCTIGGNVITWAQNFNSITIPEAIHLLASKYGIDISAYERPLTPEEIQVQRYHHICDMAAEFCNVQLLNNKQVLSWYMQDTGFDMESIIDYHVGYSVSVDQLIKHLFSTIPNLSQDDVDRLEFTNNLMWNDALVYPVKDAGGKTTRFHNKPLSPLPDTVGKYIGTSHKHPLFTNKLIYGFNLLKKNLRQTNYSIKLVEGQKAAIASGAGALLGSSLHEAQIQLLHDHHIKEVRIAFDGDSAGRAASVRLLDQMGLMSDTHILIARMPDDKQPDDILRMGGKSAIDQIFAKAVIPIAFYVDQKRDPTTGEITTNDKFSIIRDIKEYLGSISSIHLDLSAKYLAKELDVDVESIKDFASDLKIIRSGLLNKDAETALLNEVLLQPKMWSTLRQAISDHKMFTYTGYQYIYGALESAHQKARDVSGADSVTIQVVKDEIAIKFPQFKELPNLVDSILTGEVKYEFVDAIQKVVDLYRRRCGIDQSRIFINLMQDIGKPANESVSKFRRQLVSTIDVKKDDTSTPDQLSAVVLKELQVRMDRTGSIVGHDFSTLIDIDGVKIPSLTALTIAMSGLQDGHQFIISANSGVGKSLLALQMAVSLSICPHPSNQVPILWIPLEMNAIEITMRIISMLTGINNNKVQSGKFNPEEFFKVKKALDRIALSKFYIKKPRTGVIDEIYSLADEYHFKYGIRGMFTDYIQLVAGGEADKRSSREETIGRASKVLKNQIAEDMKMFSVCISQQNRQDYRQGEPGKIENVSGSYQVSQDADDFIILAEKTDEQMSNNQGNRICFIDKRRGGQSDIKLDMDLDMDRQFTLRYSERVPPEQMMGLKKI